MYFPQLNFTRFLAATAIVIFHFGQNAYPFNFVITEHLVQNLDAVISYFFIISGFVLTLANTKQGQTDFSISKKTFWLSRLARIYPLYLLTILFITLIDRFTQIQLSTFLFNISLTQAWIPGEALTINTVCWTLSVEIFFYICFPYILPSIASLNNKKLITFMSITWIVNIILSYITLSIPGLFSSFYFCPLNHFASFILGISAAVLLTRNYAVFQNYNKTLLYALILTGISTVFLLGLNTFFVNYKHSVLMAPLSLLVLLTLSSGSGKLIKILSHQAPVYLGKLSYALYVLQIPVYILFHVYILRNYHFTTTENFFYYLTCLLLSSVICHELIEKRMRNYIRKRF